MQHVVGRFDDLALAAKLGKTFRQRFGSGAIGSVGQADHDTVGSDQDIAAVGKARWQLDHGLEHLAKGRGDFLDLAGAARRAWAEEDRPLGKDQRRDPRQRWNSGRPRVAGGL